MAQKVSILLVDDLDGTEATQTVAFGLDGTDYEIDLNDGHADTLRDALAQYVGHARKVGKGKGRSTQKVATTGTGDKAAVREWAKAQGMEVSERGRIPAEVQEAYDNRNNGTPVAEPEKSKSSRRRNATVDASGKVEAK